MKKALSFLANILGFEKLGRYEKNYLHDANIRSCSYMGFIVVLLELWMLIRQTYTKIIPKYQAGGDLLQLVLTYTTKYWLFTLVGLGVMLLCLFYRRDRSLSKGRFIALFTVGTACMLYTLMLKLERFTAPSETITPVMATIMNVMLVSIYVLLFLIGAGIVTYASVKYFKKRNIVLLEHVTIIEFTLICLAFGVYVSYSDFWGGKEIICFLTMVLYVGCLLIYRPYITILILGASFLGFYHILQTYQGGLSFGPQNVVIGGVTYQMISGDSVNFITFFISLSTICFAIYHSRLSEARKATALEKSVKEDQLTGLYNYNYFIELAKDRIQNLTWNINENMLLFLDVHNFKAFNDQRGFEAGNQFLASFGQFIAEAFQDSLYARQADDHFVVLTNAKDIQDRLNTINRRVHDYDHEILLCINCGAYRLSSNTEDPRRSIDRARYAAQLIKNRFQTIYIEYDQTMSDAYHKRLYIINSIDNAVQNGWIVPFYQPVVWSDTGKVCSCEVLARWMDPVYNQLFPNEFIPVLEEYRLIHKLDLAIYELAFKDMRASMDAGRPVVPVSLNFSRLDFELMDAVQELDNLAAKYRIPRNMIHVEVTESALTDNFTLLSTAINRLKELGYSLWLDDFGSGYSSLNVLKDYQFDVIKIDMRFLSNFENSEKSKTLIECIINMANRINMLTLTEGVETKEQAEFLNRVGCGRLQGYLFSKPVPLKTLYERIEKGELTLSEKY